MISKIGKYEVIRKIGVGGWGSVYEARDPLIRRTVAVKTCETKDPEIRARFFQEAQLGGSLRHRNITTVYDFGVDEGMPYLVQEFLDGDDLDRIIARPEQLSLFEKVQILIGIAYGLEYAHNAGVIHRDVKPGNIRVLSDRTVKLMDFGIAKLATMGPHRTGRNMGTLAYLAPERILEHSVDARADVFSFGVVAYELLAGRRPFVGEIEEELFDNIVTAEPTPLAEIAPDVPAVVAGIVNRALRKAPEDRYPSIEPMRKALLAAFQSLFGRDAPLTASVDHPAELTSVAADRIPQNFANTRDLRVSTPLPVPAPVPAPPLAAGPPTHASASDARPVVSPGQRSFPAGLLTGLAIAFAFIGVLIWSGSLLRRRHPEAPSEDHGRPLNSRPEIRGLPVSPVPVSPSPVLIGVALPSPAPVEEQPSPPRVAFSAPVETSVRPPEQPSVPPSAHPGRAMQVPVARPVSKEISRYARAADEPGLSTDTRVAIYLSGAAERYRAGDESAARKLLVSAFALQKDLSVDPSQYDIGFRRLADRVRSEGN